MGRVGGVQEGREISQTKYNKFHKGSSSDPVCVCVRERERERSSSVPATTTQCLRG